MTRRKFARHYPSMKEDIVGTRYFVQVQVVTVCEETYTAASNFLTGTLRLTLLVPALTLHALADILTGIDSWLRGPAATEVATMLPTSPLTFWQGAAIQPTQSEVLERS